VALQLILDLRHRNGLTVLFISHNLGVIEEIADGVGVKAERNEAMTVVATGGVASLFHGATAATPRYSNPFGRSL
jgi:ABC-type glutathione transport system ATPase component